MASTENTYPQREDYDGHAAYAEAVTQWEDEHADDADDFGRQLAAEAERRALIMQAVRQHAENETAEQRRFLAELDHINAVCDSRTHNPTVIT
jgi:hypothetical protein